jgi:hypothetical protein
MDDRFDYMLTNAQIIDGVAGAGLEYIGNQAIAFSTTTWNDPNHSFRTWGNDGSFYNTTINTTAATNAMVGPVIAQALYDAAVTDAAGGHVPIFADFRVPPRASASTLSINLGQIPQNQATSTSVIVSNSGDVGLWTSAGVGTLRYTLSGASGLTAPGGTFTALAGAAGNTHSIGVDTSVVGTFSRSLTIASNSSEEPTLVVQITGEVTGGGPAVCYANCDGSTLAPVLNAGDFICFLSRFQAAQSLPAAQQVGDYANCDGSGVAPVLNAGDFTCFLSRFRAGCP